MGEERVGTFGSGKGSDRSWFRSYIVEDRSFEPGDLFAKGEMSE